VPVTRWTLQPAQSAAPAAVVVSKVWIQTWLVGGVRQERVVFRLATGQDQVRIRLPASPGRGSVQVGVNGQSLVAAVREPASVTLDLPAAARGRDTVVELWYSVPHRTPAMLAASSLTPPLLEGGSPPRRVYWQVCLAAGEHLVVPPSDWDGEMRWAADQWPLGRQTALDQEQLESWTGASRQDPLPRGVNTYLFSTLGSVRKLEFTAADRRTLLVLGAGAALAIGLALVHLPALRRPETLLLVATAIAALALLLPDTAVLLAQAAALGLVIALAAAAWVWGTSGRTLWPEVATGKVGRPGPEILSTEAAALRAQRAAPLSTASPVGSVGEQGL
jgi:hypothetical protein